MTTVDAEGNLHDTSGRFAPQPARRPSSGLADHMQELAHLRHDSDDDFTDLDAARARCWQAVAETANAQWRQAVAQVDLLKLQALAHAPNARRIGMLWKGSALYLHDIRDADGQALTASAPLEDIQAISAGPIGWNLGDPRYRAAARQDAERATLFWIDVER